jgi:hypothetical protein
VSTFDGALLVSSPIAAPLPGRGDGPTLYRRVDSQAVVAGPTFLGAVVVPQTRDQLTEPTPAAAITGVAEPDLTSPGRQFFERVHLIPAAIDFGSIVTQVDVRFQLFSSYRRETITLQTITNNAQPGVDVVHVTAPSMLGPLSGYIDPASDEFDPLGAIVRALQDGLAQFSSTIVFTFDVGTLTLAVVGTRLALILERYESTYAETLDFLTNIITRRTGGEQRIAVRRYPRQIFDVDFLLDGDERRRFRTRLLGWQDRVFALPIWRDEMALTSPITADDLTINVDSTANIDLRVGSFLSIVEGETFDVIRVESFTATTITLDSPVTNSYTIEAGVAPARTVYAQDVVRGLEYKTDIDQYSMRLQVTDNSTGAGDGSHSGLSTLDGIVVLDDANFIEDPVASTIEVRREIFQIDGLLGRVYQGSPQENPQRSSTRGFIATTRAEAFTLYQRILAFRGRQVPFWKPTFKAEVVAVETIGVGSDSIKIKAIDYARYLDGGAPTNRLRIVETDGTVTINEIVSAVDNLDGTETLTVADSWASTIQLADIDRIEYLELCRFDTDSIRFQHGPEADGLRAYIPVATIVE